MFEFVFLIFSLILFFIFINNKICLKFGNNDIYLYVKNLVKIFIDENIKDCGINLFWSGLI